MQEDHFIDTKTVEDNIQSLLDMVIDLNERVRLIEGILTDQGLAKKISPEIDEYSTGGLFEEAKTCIADRETVSVAYLQKVLRISHIRAFRLLEALEGAGFIAPYRGTSERVVNQKL